MYAPDPKWTGRLRVNGVCGGLVRLAYRRRPTSAIDTGGTWGIPGLISSLGHEPHHCTMFRVEVDDVQAHLDKAVAFGAKLLVPPINIPTGTLAWLSDLDGNMIGLLEQDSRGLSSL